MVAPGALKNALSRACACCPKKSFGGANSNGIQIVSGDTLAAITFPEGIAPRIESDGNNPLIKQLHAFTYLHCGARAAIC